jgi:hypothetical protein
VWVARNGTETATRRRTRPSGAAPRVSRLGGRAAGHTPRAEAIFPSSRRASSPQLDSVHASARSSGHRCEVVRSSLRLLETMAGSGAGHRPVGHVLRFIGFIHLGPIERCSPGRCLGVAEHATPLGEVPCRRLLRRGAHQARCRVPTVLPTWQTAALRPVGTGFGTSFAGFFEIMSHRTAASSTWRNSRVAS